MIPVRVVVVSNIKNVVVVHKIIINYYPRYNNKLVFFFRAFNKYAKKPLFLRTKNLSIFKDFYWNKYNKISILKYIAYINFIVFLFG